MKILILTLAFLLSFATFATPTVALRRSNGLLRFVAQQEFLKDGPLSSLIGARCKRYLPKADERFCREAVKKMLTLLDYDIIFGDGARPTSNQEWTPKSFVFIAFKSNLVSLLNQNKTTLYLSELNQELYQYLIGAKSRMNIWEFTQKYFGSDAQAAMAMAAFFQDTSNMKLHLAYLDRSRQRGSVHFQSNKELLSRVIDTINLILDSSEEYYRKLFYPEDIQQSLNRNIYHFYVPRYLSESLITSSISQEDAFRAVLMLTLTYEFITSAQDYRYLYDDPEKIGEELKIKDIFGGYCGSSLGIGRVFSRDFQRLRQTFATSSAEGVKLLLEKQ